MSEGAAPVPYSLPIPAGNAMVYASPTVSRHSVLVEMSTHNGVVIAVMSPAEARRVARSIEAAADAAEPRS